MMPVYFIQSGEDGPIKIGLAENPKKRLHQLQTGNFQKLNLVAIVDGGESTEKGFHSQFKSYRLKGEWFSICPAMIKIIEANRPPAEQSRPVFFGKIVTHGEFIDALGGTGAVAELTGRDKSTVSVWRDRGISWMCRPTLADVAKRKKIDLPDGFLDPIPHLGRVS